RHRSAGGRIHSTGMVPIEANNRSVVAICEVADELGDLSLHNGLWRSSFAEVPIRLGRGDQRRCYARGAPTVEAGPSVGGGVIVEPVYLRCVHTDVRLGDTHN